MLTYSKSFWGCPLSCWIEAKKAKITENDLAAGYISGVCLGEISIWGILGRSIPARNLFVRGICINVELFGISSWFWIKYGFIDVLLNFGKSCSGSIIMDLLCMLKKLSDFIYFPDWTAFRFQYMNTDKLIEKLCIDFVDDLLQVLGALLTCQPAMYFRTLFRTFFTVIGCWVIAGNFLSSSVIMGYATMISKVKPSF